MSLFKIVVDSGCDLPPEFINEHEIDVLPIPFELDGVPHNHGYWQEINEKDFYNSLRKGSVAKTTLINPEVFSVAFSEYIRQGRDALFILLSSGLSATFNNAKLALSEVTETYENVNLYPIDSLGATSAQSLLAIMAVKMRSKGFTAEETAASLEKEKHKCFGFFTVDDLMYLHRGGRLSKLSAVAGSVLGVKPILNLAPDGTLALKDKARNRKAALNMMVSQLQRSVTPGKEIDTVLINHTDCPGDAETLAGMVNAAVSARQTIIMTMGPVVGAHLGPGAVTLLFEADITREEYESKYYS
jgi:DegV family protein with EDD domain